MDLSRGDLVMTGTTGGVAMNLTPELLGKVTSLAVPGQDKIDMLVEDQEGNGRYLKDGDVIRRCHHRQPESCAPGYRSP
ncbi:hypothetical protein [Salinicoccus roseus]|uniref:Uncharacterized protein n=1 Tax=Salinicoccus roseus TaxID=45670 RepID=A0A265E7K3_9STAP|nr:hypothetical protein [Salinicoccus roseus]OZT77553.1 hypothetical protein CFN03_06350 [Salinicoccus roseus]